MHGPDLLAFDLDIHTVFKLVGHLSYALVALAFLVRDILMLRLVAIAASLCNIGFSMFAREDPNLIASGWQALFVCINTVWSIRLIRERRGVQFSEEEKELYQTIFRAFSPVEFMKLMRLANWQNADVGHRFATKGDVLDSLLLLYNGEAEVELSRGERPRLKDGSFIGEMSFIRGGGATATVSATRPTRYLSWRKEDLHALLVRNPSMRTTMQTVFSEDLTNKLIGGDEGQR